MLWREATDKGQGRRLEKATEDKEKMDEKR